MLISIILLGGFLYWGLQSPQHTAEERKALSIQTAEKRLKKYVKLEGLNYSDFRGPYSSKDDYNPRGETYNML